MGAENISSNISGSPPPNLVAGGYGQFTFHFNYWGPTAVNRDTHVVIQKMDKLEW